MDFLVAIDNHWPAEGGTFEHTELVELEAARARELASEGTIQRLWRIPGRRSNVGIWSAGTVDELDVALRSLPFFPWLEIDVTPLATHPNDPAPRGKT